MTNSLFADAGYWIALLDERDYLHTKAVAISQLLQNRHIVTSQAVLIEYLNFYSGLNPSLRQQAAQMARAAHFDSTIEVVPLSSNQFMAALDFYERHQDKRWSLVD